MGSALSRSEGVTSFQPIASPSFLATRNLSLSADPNLTLLVKVHSPVLLVVPLAKTVYSFKSRL